jgi:hypothetical protein
MLEKSHKLTRIFTKYILLLCVAPLLMIAIIRGVSCRFVANYFWNGNIIQLEQNEFDADGINPRSEKRVDHKLSSRRLLLPP